MDYIMEHRADGEPIVAAEPFDFFVADYYCRGRFAPRLLVKTLNRARVRGTAHLRDNELVTAGALLKEQPSGVWLISSRSYDPKVIVPFTPPDDWTLAATEFFARDHFLEQKLTVSHYILGSRRRDR
ncbi:MAG: hypothetical protein ACREHD_27345 [Pirellulales bacterium]